MADPVITIDQKAGTMTIVMPLQTPTASQSGKTMVIASTHGNLRTQAKFNGEEVTIGVNAYFKPTKKK